MLLKKKKAINEEDRQEQELFQGREHLPCPQFNSQKSKINKQKKYGQTIQILDYGKQVSKRVQTD